MANTDHLNILLQGVESWNTWRSENPAEKPDLIGARLKGAQLDGADLSGANLSSAKLGKATLNQARLDQAILGGADLTKAQLSHANLTRANLYGTIFTKAKLTNANLSHSELRYAKFDKANLREAILSGASANGAKFLNADLSGAQLAGIKLIGAKLSGARFVQANLEAADLRKANLSRADFSDATLPGCRFDEAILTQTNLNGARLDNSHVYGISAWEIKGKIASQNDLIITKKGEAVVTADNIRVAQFLYLLMNNKEIRSVIDTITSKAVLILGRFYKERKDILDAIREELRKKNYLPILFDFEKPASRDLSESIMILAQMSRFIIADITDAKSVPQELSHIIPNNPSIPVIPIISQAFREYAMFEHFARYPWVLPLYIYDSKEQLLDSLEEKIITPAEQKAIEMKPGPGR